MARFWLCLSLAAAVSGCAAEGEPDFELTTPTDPKADGSLPTMKATLTSDAPAAHLHGKCSEWLWCSIEVHVRASDDLIRKWAAEDMAGESPRQIHRYRIARGNMTIEGQFQEPHDNAGLATFSIDAVPDETAPGGIRIDSWGPEGSDRYDYVDSLWWRTDEHPAGQFDIDITAEPRTLARAGGSLPITIDVSWH